VGEAWFTELGRAADFCSSEGSNLQNSLMVETKQSKRWN